MSKSARSFPRPLSAFAGAAFSDALKAQGFASAEIVTRWADIAGPEIAAHSEPVKINWPRANASGEEPPEPATLILRVEGPAAIEIQHLATLILERVNRFFGWRAIGRLSLRQAPLKRRPERTIPRPPDPALTASIAAGLTGIEEEDLRQALARLAAAIKQT